jgi:hypothetical protein
MKEKSYLHDHLQDSFIESSLAKYFGSEQLSQILYTFYDVKASHDGEDYEYDLRYQYFGKICYLLLQEFVTKIEATYFSESNIILLLLLLLLLSFTA